MDKQPELKLTDGSRVAVMGGGPAGSFFSYFLLDMAKRAGLDIHVDIYEPRDFTVPGPPGCNMCGGIVSESLVQNLATEGIILPPTVVQRGIDSYVLHTDQGSVQIDTPLYEKRIGAVYRGPGPRGLKEFKWGSFDGHLQSLAVSKGAQVIRARVEQVNRQDGRLEVKSKNGAPVYDLLAVTADHGNDPSTPSTDHSREYVPVLLAGPQVLAGVNLGTRPTFADLGQTIADNFGVPRLAQGTSFLDDVLEARRVEHP